MSTNNDDAVNAGVEQNVVAPAAPKERGALARFLREVMVELKKTTWPSRNELAKSTAVIMITIVTVAIFLSVVDQIAMRLAAVAFNVK